jgi:hypothetical protein
MAEAKEELLRRHFEGIFNQKNLAVCDEIMAEDFVEHWATRDDLTAMLQLGIIRPPGTPVSEETP